MIHPPRSPAIVLLVALAIFVGAPLFVHAQERPQSITIASCDGTEQPQSQPELITNNGDPDDWASKTGGGSEEGGDSEGTDASDVKWQDYLKWIRGIVLQIKMKLDGI